MVVKKYILKTLNTLNSRYNESDSTHTPIDAIYFSKLALLEYCGWLEQSFDVIVRRSVKGKLKTQAFHDMRDAIIGNTHGFQYKLHFRPMLTRAIGLRNMEEIEMHLKESGKFEILVSGLLIVKEDRGSAAHTWVDGPTRTYPAPSLTISRLETIFPIIKSIYSQIVRL